MMVSTQKRVNNKINVNKILIVLLIGGFMSMLNETAVNIAFPHIMLQFHISAGTVQWLTTIYVLVCGIVFLTSAFLIQRFSTRKLFTSSMGFLIAGTTVVCLSPNFPVLLAGRLIQAIGTGILVPLIFNTILILVPAEKRGTTMGLVTLVIVFAPMIAPVLMGFTMEFMSWHCFFVFLLISFVFISIAGSLFLSNVSKLTHPKLDILSVTLATAGFGGVVIGLSGLGEKGLSSEVTIPLVVGILSLALFVARQLKLEHPMLNLKTFRYSFFSIGIVITMVNVMSTFAVAILLPIYLQNALGTTSFVTSMVMLPGSILGGILPLVSGCIYDKKGPKMVISSGLAVMCLSMLLFAGLSDSTLLEAVVLICCGIYAGSSFVMAPNQTNTLGNLPSKYYASGSAIMTSLQQIGGSIGSSLFVSFMSFGQHNYLQNIVNPTHAQQVSALISGVDFAFMIGAAMLAFVFVLSLFLKRKTNPTGKIGKEAGKT